MDSIQKTLDCYNADEIPMVSILAITYNHEKWIARALDSFVSQKTNFKFEILVHDDASTDSTPDIIREYVRLYPDLIRPIFQVKNQYSVGNIPHLFVTEMAKGNYLAFCECDDFWNDPYKLQKQVDLLEAYPECSMCVAYTETIDLIEGEEILRGVSGAEYPNRDLNFDDIFTLMPSLSTYLLRAECFNKAKKWFGNIVFLDKTLLFIMADIGPIKVLPEVVSAHLNQDSGVWTSLNARKKHYFLISVYEELCSKYKQEHRHKFAKQLVYWYIESQYYENGCVKKLISLSTGLLRTAQLTIKYSIYRDTYSININWMRKWYRSLLSKLRRH